MAQKELQQIGQCAYDSIECMVEALDADYERLEELREELEDADLSDCEREAIREEIAEIEEQADGCESEEDAQRRIWEDALSVEVRSDWHSPGACAEDAGVTDFRILLSTGGPATRIVGTLNCYGEPDSAVIEAQDWFQPWTPFEGGDEDVLLRYCQLHYFGE